MHLEEGSEGMRAGMGLIFDTGCYSQCVER